MMKIRKGIKRMNNPEYANDTIYKKLAKLCESAGRPIRYEQLDDDIYARTREFDNIVMPEDERYKSSEHAAMVLGHELGHQLLAEFYCDTEHNNSEVNEALRVLLESQCDFAGVILYKLAEMIAVYEAETIWRDNT